jgi:glycerol uptake facilitator-like aquaporin
VPRWADFISTTPAFKFSVHTGDLSDAWLYLTAPIVGAIVAAVLHTDFAQERMATNDHRAAAGTPAE